MASIELEIEVTGPLQKKIPSSAVRLTGDKPKTPTEFTLELQKEDVNSPNPTAAKQTVKGSGELHFGELSFDRPGTYIYKLSELNYKVEGYNYDPQVYTLQYSVSDKDGQLDVDLSIKKSDGSVHSPDEMIVFTNSYKKLSEKEPADTKLLKAKNDAKKLRVARLNVKVVRKGKFNLYWKKNRSANGYQVMYRLSNAKSYKTLKLTTKTKYTSKKLKKGRKYIFRIRTYKMIRGERVYGKWVYSKAVKCK